MRHLVVQAYRFVDVGAADDAAVEAATALINSAYEVETGDTGVAFKKSPRFDSPAEVRALLAKPAVRCFAAVPADAADDAPPAWQGLLVWELEPKGAYFGPFAVRRRGGGVGRVLLDELERRARGAGADALCCSVINHRADLFPMYAKLGFEPHGTAAYEEVWKLTRPAHFVLLRRAIAPQG